MVRVLGAAAAFLAQVGFPPIQVGKADGSGVAGRRVVTLHSPQDLGNGAHFSTGGCYGAGGEEGDSAIGQEEQHQCQYQ